MEFSKSHEANQLTQDRNAADSSVPPLDGLALVSEVVHHTGIAGTLIEPELSAIIEGAGHSASTLTLEQLRAAMLSYLESLNVGMGEDDEPEEDEGAEIFYEGAD